MFTHTPAAPVGIILVLKVGQKNNKSRYWGIVEDRKKKAINSAIRVKAVPITLLQDAGVGRG